MTIFANDLKKLDQAVERGSSCRSLCQYPYGPDEMSSSKEDGPVHKLLLLMIWLNKMTVPVQFQIGQSSKISF